MRGLPRPATPPSRARAPSQLLHGTRADPHNLSALSPRSLAPPQELEASMNDVYQKQLIPRQKDAFLCSARCCDSSKDMGDLQQW